MRRLPGALTLRCRWAGRRKEADCSLGLARDLYEQFGATVYVRRCDRERRAGGVNVERGPRQGLTPQEKAVAALVAAGNSNAEVADELYLSIKTIQYHLTRVYAKLGIRGRGELAAVYAENTPSAGTEDGGSPLTFSLHFPETPGRSGPACAISRAHWGRGNSPTGSSPSCSRPPGPSRTSRPPATRAGSRARRSPRGSSASSCATGSSRSWRAGSIAPLWRFSGRSPERSSSAMPWAS